VLVDPPMDGASNMARDHALALGIAPGRGVLRLYRWVRPTISLGRNEPAGRFRDRARALDDLCFVRRPTGGRAVLHDREITYAVAVPLRALGGVRQTYRKVNQGLVNALRSLGVSAELAPEAHEAARPDAGPCFQQAAPGEVTVAGRKLVGSAQARIAGALLQHGSLLMDGRQDLLEPGASERGAPVSGAVSLAELLGASPSWECLAEAVAAGLAEALGGRWHESSGPCGYHARSEAELVSRYRSPAWTWRR
jgi:lipoate-protein ligase A